MSNGLSWRRPGKVWMAWLTSTLMAGFCTGKALAATDASPSTPVVTTTLEYQETDYHVINWNSTLTTTTTPFKAEPAVTTGKTLRGVLHFGGNASNDLAFIWLRDTGKLYLDLNRNEDLTDDAAGVFSTKVSKPIYYQTFTRVHLPLGAANDQQQVLVDLNFWDYGSQSSCNVAVRSFWSGKVTLSGRDWQVGLIENNLSPAGAQKNNHLLLRPWEQRSQSFSSYDQSGNAFPFTRNIFINGHAYQLEPVAAVPTNTAQPSLRFTEQSVTLGQLKLNGKYIKRLALTEGPYLVLLEQPGEMVNLPVGSYDQPLVRLENQGSTAYAKERPSSAARKLVVTGQTTAVLNLGGPLTNTVTAHRYGSDLALDYELIGAGGEAYQLVDENRAQPPEFTVYQGGQQIAAGKFEFG